MARGVSLRAVRERCDVLERHVLRHGFATKEELADYRPGGRENTDRRVWGWCVFYGQLLRFKGRGEALAQRSEHLSGSPESDAIVLDALRGEPVALRTLHSGAVLYVYPKSLDALLNCTARDYLLGWLAERLQTLRERGTADDVALIERTTNEISYQYALLAWVVTHPEPGLPFDPRERKPEPPAVLRTLDPFDYLRVVRAHVKVNGERLQALDALIAPSGDTERQTHRPSWAVFIGTLAKELKQEPQHLMRDVALVELLAMVRLATPPEDKKGKKTGDPRHIEQEVTRAAH